MLTMSSGDKENNEGIEPRLFDKKDPVFHAVAEADMSLNERMSLACRQGKLNMVELFLKSGACVEYENQAGNTPLLEACSQGHIDVACYLLDHNAKIDALRETTSDSALTLACTLGNEAIVELLLERTSDVEHRTKNGSTALIIAALAGHVKVAAMLLDHGAKINVESGSSKESPLTCACWKGHCDVVELLLERNANIEHHTKQGFTPLMIAALEGHTDVACKLLERKAKVNIPSGSNNDIPLTRACRKGHHDVVKLLLEFNSNIEHCTKDGCTPLMLAAWKGHYSVAKLILDSNAEVNIPSGSENNIPLTLACWKGHTNVVELLLEHKSNIEHCNKAGCTPLMLASREGHVKTTCLLLSKGAEINTPLGSDGDTPLTLACRRGHGDVASVLLKHNSKVDHQTKTGCTPLIEAAREGHVAVAKQLLAHSADVELPDNCGQSPLFIACWKGHRDVAELLLKSFANRDCRTKTGITPLRQACCENHVDVVELLLDYGASVNAPFPNSRENPLTLAARKGHVKLVSLLLSRNANVECHTKKGCTPFHLACKEGHLEIGVQLLEKGADTEAKKAREQKVQQNTGFLRELKQEKEDPRKKKAAAKQRDRGKRKKAAKDSQTLCGVQVGEDLLLKNRPQEMADDFDHGQEDNACDVVDTSQEPCSEELLTGNNHQEIKTEEKEYLLTQDTLKNRQITDDNQNKLKISPRNKMSTFDSRHAKPKRPLSSTGDVSRLQNSPCSHGKGHAHSQMEGKETQLKNNTLPDKNSREKSNEPAKITKRKVIPSNSNKADSVKTQKIKSKTKTMEVKASQGDQRGNCPKLREFATYLKEGSKAMTENKNNIAVCNYGEAVALLKEHGNQYQIYEMKETDFVILLYSFGAALLEVGGREELQAAKKHFESILVEHKTVVFPLAYLGTGRVFFKQNRFTEAIDHLEEGLVLVNKLGDEKLASYRWPRSQVIIDDTKPGKLLSCIQTLIRICRHPPRPDAICRYPNCANKAQIYLTDPDYKGYVRLICHENCKVDFHPGCWKKQKSSDEGKTGDKDFLNDICVTPDCVGSVTNVQIYDMEGLKTEFKHEKPATKQESKPKQSKQNKLKAYVAGAKQKKKKDKDDIKIEDFATPETSPSDIGEEKVVYNPPPPPPLPGQKEGKAIRGDHNQLEKSGQDSSDASIPTGDGVFILKKEEDEDLAKGVGVKGVNKVKTKKKKLKNTQTLDEFLEGRGGLQILRPTHGEDNKGPGEILHPKCKSGRSQTEMEALSAIPPHFQGSVAESEIKLLELRRDMGLRSLGKALQASREVVNTRITGPKVEEVVTAWKNFASECHQRIVQCKASYDEQIELLKSGRTLSSLPQLSISEPPPYPVTPVQQSPTTFNEQIDLLKNGRTLSGLPQLNIPGPPPYPGIPVQQSLVPGQQQNQTQAQLQAQPPLQQHLQPQLQPQYQPSPESNILTPEPPVPTSSASANTGGPLAAAPLPVVAAVPVGAEQPLVAGNLAVGGAMAVVQDKARPSNRLELTGFIKEVRSNKHGSLIGLSLEEIVASVSELVEQEKMAGLLRTTPVPHAKQPEREPCVICGKDMNMPMVIETLECGHSYHSTCIRKWSQGDQIMCPACLILYVAPNQL